MFTYLVTYFNCVVGELERQERGRWNGPVTSYKKYIHLEKSDLEAFQSQIWFHLSVSLAAGGYEIRTQSCQRRKLLR